MQIAYGLHWVSEEHAREDAAARQFERVFYRDDDCTQDDFTLLDVTLKRFEDSLSYPLPNNNNFPLEIEARYDPATYEYYDEEEERCTFPHSGSDSVRVS